MALTTVQELQTLIQQKIRQKMPQSNLLNQLENTEKIAIVQSVGRVLAQDVISPLNVPNANVPCRKLPLPVRAGKWVAFPPQGTPLKAACTRKTNASAL